MKTPCYLINWKYRIWK